MMCAMRRVPFLLRALPSGIDRVQTFPSSVQEWAPPVKRHRIPFFRRANDVVPGPSAE